MTEARFCSIIGCASPFTFPDFKEAKYPGILNSPCDKDPSLSAFVTVRARAFALSVLQP